MSKAGKRRRKLRREGEKIKRITKVLSGTLSGSERMIFVSSVGCCSCIFMYSLWFEGMSSHKSGSSSWKRQREALTSSHAVTGPLVCSDSPTTACSLRSGLRLPRLFSSLETSVSSLRWTACCMTPVSYLDCLKFTKLYHMVYVQKCNNNL